MQHEMAKASPMIVKSQDAFEDNFVKEAMGTIIV
jgi:hypothetical protein